MSSVDLRPLSLGELLDRTFTLYRSHFWLFVGIMAVPQLFILALNLAGAAAFGVFPGQTSPQHPAAAPGMGVIMGTVAVSVVAAAMFLAGYVLAQGATVYGLSEIYVGRSASIRQAYARVGRMLGRLLLLFLLIALATGVGLILLVIPGIIILIRTAVAVPVAVVEDQSATDSFSRSGSLTQGYWGRVFLIWLLFFILHAVAEALFIYPFQIGEVLLLKQGQHSMLLVSLAHIGNFLATVLVSPLATIAFSLLYFDLRIRKEAFDLQVMMSSLQPVPPPSAVPPAATGA